MLREWLIVATHTLVPVIEGLALLLVTAGTLEAFVNGCRVMILQPDRHDRIRMVWMRHGRWLIAGLTFLLAADIIETAIAPTWEEIGKLAAIAAIRTFLGFFLEGDQRELWKIQRETAHAPEAGGRRSTHAE